MSTMRLSNVENFDTEKIMFSDAKETAIPGSYRITIGVQHKDNSTGPLIFTTDSVYSFGVQENKSLDKPNNITGYSIPLCLWNRDGPTDYQVKFIDTINKVSDHIKKYLLKPEIKKSVKKYDLMESDLRKFNPLWYKKEDGEIVEGRGPMLYPKLMCDKTLKIYTFFANQRGHEINPMTLISQRFTCRVCMKIESIFIGSKISLQIKVSEVEVFQQGNQRQRLICTTPTSEDEQEEQNDVEIISDPKCNNPFQDMKGGEEERKLEFSEDEEEFPHLSSSIQSKTFPSTSLNSNGKSPSSTTTTTTENNSTTTKKTRGTRRFK